MFDLSQFASAVRDAFHSSAPFWPIAVDEAIDSGVRDANKLADIIFYMHHPERMDGLTGRPIEQGEAEFEALVEQWQQFRHMALSLRDAQAPSGGGGGRSEADDWALTEAERRSLLRLGGQALVDWAETPPSARAEAMAFTSPRSKLKGVLAWKSRDPATTCTANPRQRVQLYLMRREDEAFWEDWGLPPSVARIIAATEMTTNRIYREHIVGDKLCPQAAFNREVGESRKMILKMAGGLAGLLQAPAGSNGPKIFRSLEKLIDASVPMMAGDE